MPMNAPRESATIYQFPVGGRAGLTASRTGQDRRAEIPAIAFGGSWYHDEAIREAAETTRKN